MSNFIMRIIISFHFKNWRVKIAEYICLPLIPIAYPYMMIEKWISVLFIPRIYSSQTNLLPQEQQNSICCFLTPFLLLVLLLEFVERGIGSIQQEGDTASIQQVTNILTSPDSISSTLSPFSLFYWNSKLVHAQDSFNIVFITSVRAE